MQNNRDYSTLVTGLIFFLCGLCALFLNNINPNFISFITFSGFIFVWFDFLATYFTPDNKKLIKFGVPSTIVLFLAILCSINENGLYGLLQLSSDAINRINNASTLLAFGISLVLLSNVIKSKTHRELRESPFLQNHEALENHTDQFIISKTGYMQVTTPTKSRWFRNIFRSNTGTVNFPWPWILKESLLPSPGDLFVIQENKQVIYSVVIESNSQKSIESIWNDQIFNKIICGFNSEIELKSFVDSKSNVSCVKIKIISFEDSQLYDKFNINIQNLNNYGLKTFSVTDEIRSFLKT
ncbi:hypothetical protein J4772_31870 [Cohnella sp. LGH]|uniref:hypothetical protein n=1 Tax=Cohnella sp. LGH TaxID=1619153 RepID=UPI001AD99297|nr:hypothetical protein [Cohnella sp. LGH]QTH42053.1 hypothetical protein J4772_31870 [Cohnella sp. LGH]